MLYVCNVNEDEAANGNAFSKRVFDKAQAEGAKAVVVSAAIEADLVTMDMDERLAFLEEMGLHETGLARVIRAGYDLLHLSPSSPSAPRKRAPGRSRKDQGAAGGGRDPHRFRARLHPRRNHRL